MPKGIIYCCIPTCISSRSYTEFNKSVLKKDKEAITFHRFPKNPKRHNLWVEKVFGINFNFDFQGNRSLFLCSKHFTPDDFIETFVYGELVQTSLKRILKVTAIPSVGLPDHSSIDARLSCVDKLQKKKLIKLKCLKSDTEDKVDYENVSVDHDQSFLSPVKVKLKPKGNSITEKLRQLREEGKKRIAQLIKENEEIFKCSIHPVTYPSCSIEACVLRRTKRSRNLEKINALLSSTSQSISLDDPDDPDLIVEDPADDSGDIRESKVFGKSQQRSTREQSISDEDTCVFTDNTSPDPPSQRDNNHHYNDSGKILVDASDFIQVVKCTSKKHKRKQTFQHVVDFDSSVEAQSEAPALNQIVKSEPAVSAYQSEQPALTSGYQSVTIVRADSSFLENQPTVRCKSQSELQAQASCFKSQPEQAQTSLFKSQPEQTSFITQRSINTRNTFNSQSEVVLTSDQSISKQPSTDLPDKRARKRKLLHDDIGDVITVGDSEEFSICPAAASIDPTPEDELSSYSGGIKYRPIRPKPSVAVLNGSSVESVVLPTPAKKKLATNLDKLKKIDKLITDNNILINKIGLVYTGSKNRSGEKKISNYNKENQTTLPPLVPIGSSSNSELEGKLKSQNILIDFLVKRIKKLEAENSALQALEKENEILRAIVCQHNLSVVVVEDREDTDESVVVKLVDAESEEASGEEDRRGGNVRVDVEEDIGEEEFTVVDEVEEIGEHRVEDIGVEEDIGATTDEDGEEDFATVNEDRVEDAAEHGVEDVGATTDENTVEEVVGINGNTRSNTCVRVGSVEDSRALNIVVEGTTDEYIGAIDGEETHNTVTSVGDKQSAYRRLGGIARATADDVIEITGDRLKHIGALGRKTKHTAKTSRDNFNIGAVTGNRLAREQIRRHSKTLVRQRVRNASSSSTCSSDSVANIEFEEVTFGTTEHGNEDCTKSERVEDFERDVETNTFGTVENGRDCTNSERDREEAERVLNEEEVEFDRTAEEVEEYGVGEVTKEAERVLNEEEVEFDRTAEEVEEYGVGEITKEVLDTTFGDGVDESESGDGLVEKEVDEEFGLGTDQEYIVVQTSTKEGLTEVKVVRNARFGSKEWEQTSSEPSESGSGRVKDVEWEPNGDSDTETGRLKDTEWEPTGLEQSDTETGSEDSD